MNTFETVDTLNNIFNSSFVQSDLGRLKNAMIDRIQRHPFLVSCR